MTTPCGFKGELPTASSFLFEVDGQQIGVFSQVSGLEVRIEVATYQEGGENGYVHNLPGRMTWPHVVLRRGVTDSDALFAWVNKTAGSGFSANNNSLTRSTGAITVIGSDGSRLRAWELQGVFAVRWQRAQLRRRFDGIPLRGAGTGPPRLHLQDVLSPMEAGAAETSRSLGAQVSNRYSLRWTRPVGAPQLAVGRLAGAASVFSGLVGRPLSVRRALKTADLSPAQSTAGLPVGLPPMEHLTTWWRLAAQEEPSGGLSEVSPRASRAGPTEALPAAGACPGR